MGFFFSIVSELTILAIDCSPLAGNSFHYSKRLIFNAACKTNERNLWGVSCQNNDMSSDVFLYTSLFTYWREREREREKERERERGVRKNATDSSFIDLHDNKLSMPRVHYGYSSYYCPYLIKFNYAPRTWEVFMLLPHTYINKTRWGSQSKTGITY